MNTISNAAALLLNTDAGGHALRRLVPIAGTAAGPHMTASHENAQNAPRVFNLDAHFETAGTWAGVEKLVELAYLSLLDIGENEIVEEHLLELYMVLLKYRDRIRPKYLCLTDTATAAEKTRFYAVDRAYRLVHGLVGMVLQWKRVLHDRRRWVVIVRNFAHAQHLATRFFAELARRAEAEGEIDVVIETNDRWSDDALSQLGVQTVLAAPWIAALTPHPDAPNEVNETSIPMLETAVVGNDLLLEQKFPLLLTHYRLSGDCLAAAKIALRMLIIYNSYGYYHEAKAFMDVIVPYFDLIAGNDQEMRIHYVSKMNICLVMTNDPDGALRVVTELASSYLTQPKLIADMNYILGMHYLRYAEARDIQRAEQHILRAVDNIHAVKDDIDPKEHSFRKVFIDNGLAFLRARQGRHKEALDLCQSGYDFLTKELGEHRHLLHRSVLQYNIAQVYVMLGRLNEGLEHYKRAVLMDPYYSEYHNEMGNILQELERYGEAIEHYKMAIQYSAPYPEVYFNKAVCHARRDELEDALLSFEVTLELNPRQPEACALRADMLREIGRVDEALDGYDAAIALGYESTAVRVNRAALHYNNGSYGLALSDMDYVISQEPQEAAHYENRAAIYQALNREDLYWCDLDNAARCHGSV